MPGTSLMMLLGCRGGKKGYFIFRINVKSLLLRNRKVTEANALHILHRNSTVARRVTNDTSEHYGNPQGYDGQDGTRGATYGLSGRCLLSWGSN